MNRRSLYLCLIAIPLVLSGRSLAGELPPPPTIDCFYRNSPPGIICKVTIGDFTTVFPVDPSQTGIVLNSNRVGIVDVPIDVHAEIERLASLDNGRFRDALAALAVDEVFLRVDTSLASSLPINLDSIAKSAATANTVPEPGGTGFSALAVAAFALRSLARRSGDRSWRRYASLPLN